MAPRLDCAGDRVCYGTLQTSLDVTFTTWERNECWLDVGVGLVEDCCSFVVFFLPWKCRYVLEESATRTILTYMCTKGIKITSQYPQLEACPPPPPPPPPTVGLMGIALETLNSLRLYSYVANHPLQWHL